MDNAPERARDSLDDKGRGYVFNPYRGFYSLDPGEEERKTLAAVSGRLGNSLLAYYAVSVLVVYAARAVLSLLLSMQRMLFSGYSLPFDIITDFFGVFSEIICLLLPFFYFFGEKRRRSDALFHRPKPASTAAAVAVTLAVSTVGSVAADLMHGIFSTFHIRLIYPSYTVGANPVALAMSVIQLVIVPAVVEEVVFRGMVMQSLRKWGDTFALVASAFAFAIVHGNPLQIPYAFLMGLVIGYFVLATGSLWTGIIVHMVHNLVTVLLSVAAVVAGKNYPVVHNAVFFAIIAAALCCVIAYWKKGRSPFPLFRQEGVLTLSEKLMVLFSKWQVVLSMGLALFLMTVQYVRVG